MFIIPFFARTSLTSLCAWKLVPITIFLENRGKNLYRLSNDENADDWLQENGFFKKQSWQENEFMFVEVDVDRTKLKDFYSFEQLTSTQTKGIEECWKTFFIMNTKDTNDTSLKSWNELFEPEIIGVLQKIKTRML